MANNSNMRSSTFVLTFLIVGIVYSSNIIENKITLVVDFLINKQLQMAVTFTCFPENFQHLVAQHVMSKSIQLAMAEPNRHGLLQELNQMMAITYTNLAVILDLDCPEAITLLSEASRHRMFNTYYYWFIFKNKTTADEMEASLIKNKVELTLESEFVWAEYSPELGYELFEIYQTGMLPYGTIVKSKITYNGEHNWKYRSWKYDKRSNLHGLLLNVTAVVKPGMVQIGETTSSDRSELQDQDEIIEYLMDYSEPYLDSMSKFSWAVFQTVVDQFNFTFRLVPTSSWGYVFGGKFDGMVSLLMNGSADIAATVAAIRPPRFEVVDYTQAQIWPYQPHFIFRHPRDNGSLRMVFLQPLSTNVWICITVMVAIMFTLTQLSNWLQKNFNFAEDDDSWSSTIIVIVAATCQQGSALVPQHVGRRIVFLLLFLWAMMIYQFYTSSIVSSLLSTPPKTIRTLADLVHSSFEIGFENVLTSKDTLNRYNWHPVVHEMYVKKIAPKQNRAYFSPVDGVNCLKKGSFAFYVDPASAYKLIEDALSEAELCDLAEVYLQAKETLAMPVQKHSPYKKLLTYGIRRTMLAGITKREILRWHTRHPICVTQDRQGGQSILTQTAVGMDTIVPVFVLLSFGILLSVIILIAELQYIKLLQKRENTNHN